MSKDEDGGLFQFMIKECKQWESPEKNASNKRYFPCGGKGKKCYAKEVNWNCCKKRFDAHFKCFGMGLKVLNKDICRK